LVNSAISSIGKPPRLRSPIFRMLLVLQVATVLDGSEEPFQIGVGKQLR
jgi:hypothetical protein